MKYPALRLLASILLPLVWGWDSDKLPCLPETRSLVPRKMTMLRRALFLACVALVVTLSSTSDARAWYAAGYRAGGGYAGGYRAGGVAYGGCHYGCYGGYRAGCVRRW